MRLVFVGPPGSGKGTQARLLQDRFGLLCIGTGDLLRSAVRDGTHAGKLAEPYMAKGQLVPDDVVNARVAEYFCGANPPTKFLLDGYPRNPAQCDFLDNSLAKCGLSLTKVIFFNVPDEELVRRLEGRGLTENRADDTLDVIKQRVKLYHQATAPIVEHYRKTGLLAEVSAVGDVEEIHRKIVSFIS